MERRKRTRKELMSYSQVFDLYGGVLLGYLADLSESGAMLIGEKPVELGRHLTLKMEVPELEDIHSDRLIIDARVAWCQPDISPEFKNIGLEFTGVGQDQIRVIQAMIQKYEFTREAPKYPLRPIVKR